MKYFIVMVLFLFCHSTIFYAQQKPSEISGLVVWLDVDSVSSITLSNDSVTVWADLSGNGYNGTSVAGKRPVFQDSLIVFNGINSYFAISSVTVYDNNSTFFVLAKTADKTQFQNIIGTHSTSPSYSNGVYINNSQFVANLRKNNVGLLLAADGVKSDTFQVWTAIVDSGANYINLNGTQAANNANDPNYHTYNPFIGLSNYGGGIHALSGSIASIIIYNRSLTTTEVDSVENYLLSKFPAAPGELALSKSSESSVGILLSWADNSNNESGFIITRNGAVIDTTAKNATSYNDLSAANNVLYTYSVAAYNKYAVSNSANRSFRRASSPGWFVKWLGW